MLLQNQFLLTTVHLSPSLFLPLFHPSFSFFVFYTVGRILLTVISIALVFSFIISYTQYFFYTFTYRWHTATEERRRRLNTREASTNTVLKKSNWVTYASLCVCLTFPMTWLSSLCFPFFHLTSLFAFEWYVDYCDRLVRWDALDCISWYDLLHYDQCHQTERCGISLNIWHDETALIEAPRIVFVLFVVAQGGAKREKEKRREKREKRCYN